MEMATGEEATLATKTRVSMRLEVGDRLAEPKGGYRIRMARGESESVEVSAELLDGGRPFDAAGLSARFMAVLAGGRHVAMPVPPEGVSGGTLTYTLPSGLGATPGDTRLAVFELFDGEGYRIYTEPFTVSVTEGPSPTSAEIGPYVPELDALLAQLKAAIGSAGDAAGTASSAAAKAEAAAAEANDAAAKAEAAIAEVKATEAKLYPAAENILVGGESGTVAHVEDAFNGATLRGITVEGACKQDGTPSPEAPVPIEVVEHPVVRVSGRNLWLFASSYTSIEGHQNEFVKEGTPFTLLPGTYTFSATGSLGNTDAPLFGYTAEGKRIQLFRIMRNIANPKYGFTVTEPITSIYFVSNAADSNVGTISNIQLERNSTATEYKPHTSQSLAFNLPAEHPYLAKVGDVADTIEVSSDGSVELVARVEKLFPKDMRTVFGKEDDSAAGYLSVDYDSSNTVNKLNIMSNEYIGSGWTQKTGYIYAPSKSGFIIRNSRFPSKEVADSLIENTVVYIAAPKETRYTLTPIAMPTAPDNVVNVWTDGEVSGSTEFEYVRDVNIVVKNIEDAVASITAAGN